MKTVIVYIFFFSCTVYHCGRWLENIQIKQWIRGKKNQFTQRRWRQWQHANRPCFPSMRKAYNLMTSRNRVNAAIPSAWVLYRATVMDHLNATRSNKESTSRFVDDMPLPNLLQNSFESYTFESIDTQLRILVKLIAITVPQILDCWISSNCNLGRKKTIRKICFDFFINEHSHSLNYILTRWYFTNSGWMPTITLITIRTLHKNARIG